MGNIQEEKKLINELNAIIASELTEEQYTPTPVSDITIIDDIKEDLNSSQVEPSSNQESIIPKKSNIHLESYLQNDSNIPVTTNLKFNFENGLNLPEYKYYTGPACHDPRYTNPYQIAEDLLKIIEIEGPIQIKRAFDIYLRSCGIKRLGHDLRDTMLRSISALKNSNKISLHKYKENDDALNEIIWIYGTPAEVVRKRGDRTLEEIPTGELFQITQLVADLRKVNPNSEEHLRAILEILDLKRLTSNAEEILKETIDGNFIKI
jgi:hypothetical protein